MAAPKTAEEILKSDPFYSPDTNLDLSGHPAFYSATIPPAKPDPFEPRDSEVVHNLREALPAMVKEDFRDPEIAGVLKRAGIESPGAPSVVRVLDADFRVYFDAEKWHGTGILDGMKHHVTGGDRDEVLGKLVKLAQRAQRETIRELNEQERIQVARVAQRDRVGAINLYLSLSIPEGYADGQDPLQLINAPELRGFMANVVNFVWLNSRLDATDSEQWQSFKSQYIGGRPSSCALLDRCWDEFCNQRNRRLLPLDVRQAKEEKPQTAEEITESLEEMTDAQVDAQYKAVARHFAHA